MKIEKDIRMLSIMHFRMSSLLAFLSHSMRLLSYLAKPVNGVKEERMVFNGMKCSIFTSSSTEKGTLLSIHGGAFAFPAASHHRKTASLYAACGYRVIMPDYPLLPFHHHPEALEKILELAESLDNLSVIEGDSAGGFLAIHTVSKLKRKPDLMLIYPVVMLDYETESMRKYINTPMWNARNNRWMVKHYLASCIPPERNLQGIRKAFVETAEYDALHDEGIIIASELKALGTDTALSETEGTLHGYDFLWKKPYVRKMISRRIEWLEER